MKRLLVLLLAVSIILSGSLNVSAQGANLGQVSQGWAMGGGNPTNSHWNAAENSLYPPLRAAWDWSSDEQFIPDTITYRSSSYPNGGVIYVGGMGSRDNNVVYSLQATAVASSRHDYLWRFQLYNGGGAMSSDVAVWDRYAVFGGQHDDNIYILDALNGSLLNTIPGFDSLYEKPVKIDSGVAYACGQKFCQSIDLRSSTPLWTTPINYAAGESDLAIIGSYMIAPNPQLYPGSDAMVQDRNTGNILWQSGITRGQSIVTDGNWMYFVEASVSPSGGVAAFEVVTAAPLIPSTFKGNVVGDLGFFAQLAVTNDRLYVASSVSGSRNRLLLYDTTRLPVRWDFMNQVELPGPASSIAVANNVVYVGTGSGLYAYDAHSLQPLWSDSIRVTDLAIADGYLLATTNWGVRAYR